MTETLQIQLTPEQEAAVDAAVRCLDGETSENLTIGGLAGTGKTSCVKVVLDRMREKGKHVAVATFAGKAASVLRKKGVHQAQTLHSLMYKPDKVNGKLVFSKLLDLECDAVVVDEASMINTGLYEDLLSFGVPVVFVGDHGQLEPIGDNPGIMENPHIKLEKIHRQAEDSAILWLAHVFRQGKVPNWGTVTAREIRLLPKHQVGKVAHEYDVIICGFNKTRNLMNRMVREARGYQEELVVGERLICLKNNRFGFFNGMMIHIEAIHENRRAYSGSGPVDCYVCDVKTDDGVLRQKVTVWLAKGAESKDFPEFGREQEVVVADYGAALTCHKSQGSEYEKVLVLEEIWAEKWSPSRWRYTAATRASKELAWVKQ